MKAIRLKTENGRRYLVRAEHVQAITSISDPGKCSLLIGGAVVGPFSFSEPDMAELLGLEVSASPETRAALSMEKAKPTAKKVKRAPRKGKIKTAGTKISGESGIAT